MDAIILAGGRGNRLRPVTDFVPKPLVPINNIPILEYQIRYLESHGIKRITVCAGYLLEQIRAFLDVKRFGIRIEISGEDTPLGTGGAIKKAGRMIESESFLAVNGDVITDIDISHLISKKNAIAAIELRTNYGILDIRDDRINDFMEKSTVQNMWMNAGIYHLERDCMADLPETGDIERTLFPEYAKRGILNYVKFSDTMWHSIDSFKDIEECKRSLVQKAR